MKNKPNIPDQKPKWLRGRSGNKYSPIGDFHILPINDIKEHVESFDCWCDPVIKNDLPPYVVVHNSADRRELFEPDNPKNIIPKC